MPLSPERRRWLYAVAAPLLATGLAWAVAHYALDEASPAVRAAEAWSMKLHGGLAMAALVMLGVLLPVHVQPGLRREAHRASGLAMLALIAFLALTGYGLYYLGDEVWREGTSVTHLAIGVAAALWLVRHRRGQEGARVRIGAEKL